MITIQKLEWSNWFSYGENNSINLNDGRLIQISGTNGSGKSSIPLIIEEVLYGKNSKGIKKQELVNRYIPGAKLTAKIYFEKDGDEYILTLERKSTVSIKLIKNGEDISSHTSTNTYKTVHELLGLDFKTFSQLIYQSSTSSLEFLKATDTNRKKFLVSLFNLSRYLDIHEHFKRAYTEINREVAELSGEIKAVESWIEKHKDENLDPVETKELPEISEEDIDTLGSLKAEKANITKINSDINKNNTYKELLASIDLSVVAEINKHDYDLSELGNKKKKYTKEYTEQRLIARTLKEKIKKIENLKGQCPTCLQDIDENKVSEMIEESKSEINSIDKELIHIKEELDKLDKIAIEVLSIESKERERLEVESEFTRLNSLIDTEMSEDVLDEQELTDKINALSLKISKLQAEARTIAKHNEQAEGHNSRVEVIKDQLVEYREKLNKLYEESEEAKTLSVQLNILKKAFSTNGLISYKVEYLVKDLEVQINKYLDELSGGKFQLIFVLKDEKLNIEILDDGSKVTIEQLSAGELARVNASTLLAIRKLMSAISSTKINILFLDEIMGVLDEEGKEKLIELLQEKKDLNTFIVSHEYSHPLIPKINIIKENKISRVENV